MSKNDERTPLLSQHESTARSQAPREEPDINNSTPAQAIGDQNGQTLSQASRMLAGICVASFMYTLDTTIVATLAAPISESLGDLGLLPWVSSAYMIPTMISQVVAGKLTDIFGRRPGLYFTLFWFSFGNLVCALSRNSWQFIAGRIIAGLGGGAMGTIATFVVGDVIPLRSRGRYFGVFNLTAGLGASVGGPLGGYISELLDWRWVFYIQLPPIILSASLIWLFLDLPATKFEQSGASAWESLKRIDFTGLVLIVAALVPLLAGLNSAGTALPWDHPVILTILPLSGVLLLIFVWVELRAKEPIVPVRLLRYRTVLCGCLTNWFITMARFELIFYLPPYLLVLGYSRTETGVRLIPDAVGIMFTSLVTGEIIRRTSKYWWLNAALGTLFAVAFAIIATFGRDTPPWLPFICILMQSVGFVGMLSTTLLGLTAAVDQSYQATITSANYVFRSTGTSLSISLAGVVFRSLLDRNLKAALGPDSPDDWFHRAKSRLDSWKDFPTPALQRSVQDAYLNALHGVFVLAFGFAVGALVVGLCMKEEVLHSTIDRTDVRNDATDAADDEAGQAADRVTENAEEERGRRK